MVKRTDPNASLFYSHSDVSPFRGIPNGEHPKDNGDYVVQEPMTPGESRRNSGPIIEKLSLTERGRVPVEGSTSSSAAGGRSRTKGKESPVSPFFASSWIPRASPGGLRA